MQASVCVSVSVAVSVGLWVCLCLPLFVSLPLPPFSLLISSLLDLLPAAALVWCACVRACLGSSRLGGTKPAVPHGCLMSVLLACSKRTFFTPSLPYDQLTRR